ncbi:MAG: hypothetical protein ACTSXP_11640 [Promethearchaeota archaeon]
MIDEYRNVIANLIATILRETKDLEINKVPMRVLADIYSGETNSTVELEDILEYISTATDSAICIIYTGGEKQVQVLNKIPLYLMLYRLNYNLASVDLLHWKDFERLVEYALQENGFVTRKNFSFKDVHGKWHEIDVIGADRYSKEHLVFVIDAKHWNYRTGGSPARVTQTADDQFTRVEALGKSKDVLGELLSSMGLKWHECLLVPMLVTLLEPPFREFYIPIVSILSFNSFVMEFSENMDHFKKKWVKNIPYQEKLF